MAFNLPLIGPISALSIFGLTIGATIIYILLNALYNTFLHPLRRYPGPPLWSTTAIPYTLANIKGELPFRVLAFHRKYGPVIRIRPNELSFTDPEAWDDIYGLHSGRRQNPKDASAYTPPMPGVERGIVLANDAVHGKLRRIYGPAFTPRAVEEQSGMVMKYANLLIEQLKRAVEKEAVQDMSAWYNFTTFDLTGEFAFGEAFHCLENGGQYHFFLTTVFNGVVTGLRMMQFERYGLLTALKPFIPKSAMKPKEDMDQYCKELVDRRLERGYDPSTNDVFNYLLQNKDPEDQLALDDLYENAIALVVAGSETTATLLTGTTYFLCRHPETLKKVQREVRTAFKSDEDITVKVVNDLPYMIAVLCEALRIFPPSGFGFPRFISAEKGQMVAGHYLPLKTVASISHHAAYRYERNFARPDEFIPERWLPEAPAEFANDKRGVLQPFMVGPRGCLGKNLAYAEMRLLLAKMLWHFDFELADPADEWYEGLKAFMLWEKDLLKVRLTPVER
ncbi:hypothetical protein LTS18_000586 [Coniosporium uncinatum]|uniref:Uncharacterized protein n=1 Tax=Coniosporium uncinatum TaxID=93489 RepID=A0ACC3D8C8_9PEZI|nr:hypothetical protein LTS18_000586 [Coniosporium uncinatum]